LEEKIHDKLLATWPVSELACDFHEKAHFVKVDVAALEIVAERSS
jgi:hypothetical protein